jgi:hypothetical protein
VDSAKKKVEAYIAIMRRNDLRIKKLSFGLGIGVGSLVPVYVKYSYTSSIANRCPRKQTNNEPLTG